MSIYTLNHSSARSSTTEATLIVINDSTKSENNVQRKESRSCSFFRLFSWLSLIELRVGMINTASNIFRPLWTRVASILILICFIIYLIIMKGFLFHKILNINTYIMKKDEMMIGNATLPQD